LRLAPARSALHSFPTRRSSGLPHLSPQVLVYLIAAGLAFGLAARLFCKSGDLFNALFSKIRQPLFRPVVGGVAVVATVFLLQSTRSEEHTSELQSRENLVCRL